MKAYINAGIFAGVMDGVQQGSLLNLPDWAKLPYFALPENGVTLLQGDEITIYGDTFVNVPIQNDLQVTYTCDIGTQSGNNLTITPETIGVYPLTIRFKNKGVTFETKTINISVIPKASVGSIKALMIGDSVMETGMGTGYYTNAISAKLTGVTIAYVGTVGTVIKHEGRAGYKWTDFALNDRSATNPSPFFKNGVLDIASYFADNTLDIPELVKISLGINDLFSHCRYDGDGLTDLEVTAIINNAKILIDAFLSYNPSIEIIVSLPTICDNNGVGWDADYDITVYSQDKYIENMHKFWVVFVNTFNGGAYNSRVSVSYEVLNLNRALYESSGVHPWQYGYTPLGVAMAQEINNKLKYIIKPTDLILSLISGGVKIDWTDKTGGLAQTEIWGKSNNGEYALLYTIDAGTVTKSDTVAPVDLRYYKLRSKNGDWYSEFTAESSIAMLSAEKVDQDLWNNAGLAYWNIQHDAIWSGDGTNMISSGGGNGEVAKGNLGVATGKTYKIEIDYIVNSGTLYLPYNWSANNGSVTQSGTSVYTKLWSGIYVAMSGFSFNGKVTRFSIKEVLVP